MCFCVCPLHFVLKCRRLTLEKPGITVICFACGKTGHWRVNCPNIYSYFTAGSTYKQLPNKKAPLLGSNDSISEQIVVRETLEGISNYAPYTEKSFEFESSPSCIQTVKGRLRDHFNFWQINLRVSDFILCIIDRGYAIPFISVPQTALFVNKRSALSHADFVLRGYP